MTIEKFVDELFELDKIQDKYEYAEAYLKFMLKHMQFSVKNFIGIKKEMDKRKKEFT